MNAFVKIAASAVLALSQLAAHAADAFPSRPVTIIVPYSAGGPIDALMRGVAERLRQAWKQTVIIDNKPGANEIIGAVALAKGAPDGYTLLASTESTILLNPLLYKKLPYDPSRQFTNVSLLARSPLVFTVPASSPVNSIEEFVALARKRQAEPMRYGSTGIGGPTHLPFESLAHDNKIALTHVPYKGGMPVMQALLAGEVDAGTIGSSMIEQHVKSGKLKALAVSADARLASLPGVPTFSETGVRDINATYILGLMAPAGTPDAIKARIARDIREVLLSPEFQSKNLEPFGFQAVGSSPAEFDDYLRREVPTQKRRVELSGVQLEL